MPRLDTSSSSGGSRSGRRGRGPRVSTALAEINVVPLVDVMLVLLVIFMVTAPMMTQGVEVKLPQAKKSSAVSAEPVYITVALPCRREGQLQIGNDKITLADLPERARQALAGMSTKSVFLRADAAVPYGEVFKVTDALKMGGVENVVMVTQPPKADK